MKVENIELDPLKSEPIATSYSCEFCDLVCKEENDLRDHMIKDHRNDVQCDICEKRFIGFKRASELKKHKLEEHGVIHEQPIKCNFCGRIFDRTGNLNMHIKLKHENSREFPCEFCGKLFGRKPDARKHMLKTNCKNKLHEKPPLVLNRIMKMKSVMAKKPKRKQEPSIYLRTFKWYQCNSCKQVFEHLDKLQFHEKSHMKIEPM